MFGKVPLPLVQFVRLLLLPPAILKALKAPIGLWVPVVKMPIMELITVGNAIQGRQPVVLAAELMRGELEQEVRQPI